MKDRGVKVKKQIIGSILLVAIAILTFSIFFKGYSFQELIGALRNANYFYLLAGLSMVFIHIICEAINTQLILKVLGQPISFNSSFRYSCIGFYFGSITPLASGTQPAQVYYMKQDKISVTMSSLTIFYITLVYQISLILLGIAAFVFSFQTAIWFFSKLKYLLIVGSIINIGAILLLFLLMFSNKIMPGILFFLIKLGNKLHIVKKADETKSKAEKSIRSYREKALIIRQHPVLFLQVLFFSMVQMTAMCLIPYLVYKGMGYLSYPVVKLTACQALLSISVSAIPLPGSEGITQAGFLQVFNRFFPHSAITFAMLINRVISFYLPLIINFIIYLFAHIRTLKQSKKDILV